MVILSLSYTHIKYYNIYYVFKTFVQYSLYLSYQIQTR